MATPNNPRKFSEKIALHTQKQAEETAAFDEVMKDLSVTRAARLQLQQTEYLQLGPHRGPYYGGSLPNVNQIGNSTIDMPFQNSGLDPNRSTRHHGLVDRVYRGRIASPHQKPLSFEKHGRQMDSCPYGSVYLSPPSDTSWRRTNSDSALHQSTLTPAQHVSFTGPSPQLQPKRVLLLNVPGSEPIKQQDDDEDDDDDEESWDCNESISRSKRCRVPGINIFPSPEQQLAMSQKPSAHNSGGSLPDLTNIQFPPPLATPLDPDDAAISDIINDISGHSLGLNSSQPSLTLQPGHNNMVPLILNAGDSHQHHNLQISPTSPPLPLSQAAINAMNLEQQLSMYAFFNQQPLSQTHHNHQESAVVHLPSSVTSCPPADQHASTHASMNIDINPAVHQYRSRMGSSANQSPTSPVSNQGFSPGCSPQHNSILGSGFADFYDQQLPNIQASVLSQQLEQFNMMESSIISSDSSLYKHSSILHYPQTLTSAVDSHCSLHTAYAPHPNIPNIILTAVSGESPRELSAPLSTDISFDVDAHFPLDDLKMDPLTLDGLHMLNDPDMVLADPATEDAFRLDRL